LAPDRVSDDTERAPVNYPTIVKQTIRGSSEAASRVVIRTDYTTNEPGPIQLRVRGHVIAAENMSVTETTTPG
jgi:hypothetical protein